MGLSPQTEVMLRGLFGQAEKRASVSRCQKKPASAQQTTLGCLTAEHGFVTCGRLIIT